MRKKGSYRKNKLFCLLAAAALRFVQSYLNDIVLMSEGENSQNVKRIFLRKVVI